jgi:hypothetical protein
LIERFAITLAKLGFRGYSWDSFELSAAQQHDTSHRPAAGPRQAIDEKLDICTPSISNMHNRD